ncbi:MAG: Lrp/AsnC ligand binding domain-containing protein [Acidimicrobiales bacterium]
MEITLSSQHEDVLDEFEAAATVPEVLSCHLMAGNSDYLSCMSPPTTWPTTSASTAPTWPCCPT